jgi:hypothetical protein
VERHTTDLTGSNVRTELVYALSSQPAHHASPQQLGAPVRASDSPTLRWVNGNPARALAFLGLP